VNRKAFDDYLQGRYIFWNKRTRENTEKAIEYFQSSIRADSTYAPPYAGLANCYIFLGTVQIGAMPPIDANGSAQEAARKAIELDNELAEAHAAMGYAYHYNWNWDAAEREFIRAIELNASNADAYFYYSQYLMSQGRTEEAIAEADRAQELDPFSLATNAVRGPTQKAAGANPRCFAFSA